MSLHAFFLGQPYGSIQGWPIPLADFKQMSISLMENLTSIINLLDGFCYSFVSFKVKYLNNQFGIISL